MSMAPVAVEKALHRVLAKSPEEPLKLSKVQNKVHKRLQKDNTQLTEQHTGQLLQQVLTSSRQFVFDGKKVQLASAQVAAAPAHVASSADAATAAANAGAQAGDKRPRSDNHDHKHRKKQKAAKQLEQQQQQQQQHATPAAPQHDIQAAGKAVEQQQQHLHIKQEKQNYHVQEPDKPQHEQQQLLQPGHQAADAPRQHKQHKHQQKQPKATGHTTATAAQVSAADNALRAEIPVNQQTTKSTKKRKHKHKQPDTAAAIAVPLPQDGQQQQQQAAMEQKHKECKQEGAGPTATAGEVGNVLQQQHKAKQQKEKKHKEEKKPKHEGSLNPAAQPGTVLNQRATTLDASQQQQQQKKKRKGKHQAEQPQPAVQPAETSGAAERQTDTSHAPPPQQQQQPPHRHQQHEQQQQQQKKKTHKKQKVSQHDDQPHGNTGLHSAKIAAAAAPPAAAAAARLVPQQQHNHQQQQQQRSVAASSARELLLQVMKGFQKQSAPAAAATAAVAAAPLQQQTKASKAKAARHTVLVPAADAAAGALAAVQNRIAAQQQQEQGDIEGSPARRRSRRSDTWRADYNRTDVKHGRFSEAEKKAVHDAIVEFADEKGLPHGKGECGWLIDRKSAALKKGAITAIAAAVPHRTRKAVWQFVQANYTPVQAQGAFTPEEDAKLLELYSELGPRWKEIGGRLGRLDRAVKDRAKALNFGKEKTLGRWNEEEIDTLQSFVSAYRQALDASGSAEGDVRHISKSLLPSEDAEARPVGSVHLDDIDWEWVSSQMGSRTAKQCIERWHKRMAPGMISSGQWAPGNDTTMIQALAATPKESWQVNWEELVPGRTSQQCKRRWQVILRHLPVEVRNDFPKAVAEAAARLRQKQQKKNKKSKSSTDTAQEDGGSRRIC